MVHVQVQPSARVDKLSQGFISVFGWNVIEIHFIQGKPSSKLVWLKFTLINAISSKVSIEQSYFCMPTIYRSYLANALKQINPLNEWHLWSLNMYKAFSIMTTPTCLNYST